jgi:hypothetical protein
LKNKEDEGNFKERKNFGNGRRNGNLCGKSGAQMSALLKIKATEF